MNIILAKEFEYLNELEKISGFGVEVDGKVYTTKKIVNGEFIEEGQQCTPMPFELALERQERAIKFILAQYPKVFLRVFPEVRRFDGDDTIIYTRLAY